MEFQQPEAPLVYSGCSLIAVRLIPIPDINQLSPPPRQHIDNDWIGALRFANDDLGGGNDRPRGAIGFNSNSGVRPYASLV